MCFKYNYFITKFKKQNTNFLPSNVNPSELKPSDIPSEQVLRQMGLSEDEIKEILILNIVKVVYSDKYY